METKPTSKIGILPTDDPETVLQKKAELATLRSELTPSLTDLEEKRDAAIARQEWTYALLLTQKMSEIRQV